MRRPIGLVVVLALLVLGGAAPATADDREFKYNSLNAFWYVQEPLTGSTYRQTTWYVGVFSSAREGTWSDLYKSVEVCKTGRAYSCEFESFWIGFSSLDSGTFRMDTSRLEWGRLEETYQLQRYSKTGYPVGRPVPTHIVAELEADPDGYVDRYRDTYRFRAGDWIYRVSFDGYARTAEAYGWINGVSIGETYDSYLGHFEVNVTRKRR